VRATSLALLLGLAIGIAAACGGAPKRTDHRPDEITALWTQIRDWRREAGLPVEPRHEDVMAYVNTPMKAVEPVCAVGHAVPTTCGDVCSLADAICDNAEQICILADDLGDQWSSDKCASAKASCHEAKQRCCKCSEPTKASAIW
jgi:hypothetical protein